MSDYDRRAVPSDLLARLALALRAALLSERSEASLIPLTREFCQAARKSGLPPEGALTAFKDALGAPPPRSLDARYQRIREHLITQCIAAYYAPTTDTPERGAPPAVERPYVVAVVDDDPVVVALLTFILEERFTVRAFDDARRALAAFYEQRPDLVVLDVHLPDYSGRTLLSVLRADARLRAVPAIAVTGDDDPELEAKLSSDGFAAYFRKPLVNPGDVLAVAVRLAESGSRDGVRSSGTGQD